MTIEPAIVQGLDLTPDDTVIYLRRFSGDKSDLPKLDGITQL